MERFLALTLRLRSPLLYPAELQAHGGSDESLTQVWIDVHKNLTDTGYDQKEKKAGESG